MASQKNESAYQPSDCHIYDKRENNGKSQHKAVHGKYLW